MSPAFQQRTFFFNAASLNGPPSHPWVILSDPVQDPDNVLIVNLTDAENHHDVSCILDCGDHPGIITKRSCIAYDSAKVTSIEFLEKAHSSGLLHMKLPLLACF